MIILELDELVLKGSEFDFDDMFVEEIKVSLRKVLEEYK